MGADKMTPREVEKEIKGLPEDEKEEAIKTTEADADPINDTTAPP